MNSQQLNRIEMMLEALLKSQNAVHWIGGYAQGRTASGDPFIILYPASDKLIHKVCRVYPSDFRKLPGFIDTNVPEGAPDNNPTKEQARKNGRFCGTPLFKILTYEGRETSMGPEVRFSNTLYAGGADEVMAAAKKKAAAKPTRKRREYVGGGEVGDEPAEAEYFDLYVEREGKRPFSVDSLREWYKRVKG